ncbi:MAG: hypothetical protein JST16_14200 [Bdellovibrionales bacterium]|nr:hypothetical protein [Bdellovibrionales bacterium]
MFAKIILSLSCLLGTPIAHAEGVHADSVDNAGRFLKHLVVDATGNVVWAAFEAGANMENEPLRSYCIRAQVGELRMWTNGIEHSSGSYVSKLKEFARIISSNNFVPAPAIAINWNRGPFGVRFGTDTQRANAAIRNYSYVSDWQGIRFNHVYLEVSPFASADGKSCNIVRRAQLEYYFGMIANCVSHMGASCRPDVFDGM